MRAEYLPAAERPHFVLLEAQHPGADDADQGPVWLDHRLGREPPSRDQGPDARAGVPRIGRDVPGVPILPVAIDYSRRVIEIGTLFEPTDDAAADTAALRRRFTAAMARYPEQFATEP